MLNYRLLDSQHENDRILFSRLREMSNKVEFNLGDYGFKVIVIQDLLGEIIGGCFLYVVDKYNSAIVIDIVVKDSSYRRLVLTETLNFLTEYFDNRLKDLFVDIDDEEDLEFWNEFDFWVLDIEKNMMVFKCYDIMNHKYCGSRFYNIMKYYVRDYAKYKSRKDEILGRIVQFKRKRICLKRAFDRGSMIEKWGKIGAWKGDL